MGYKLLFSIVNQELIREDNVFLVNKTQKFVEAEFTFKTPEWDDLEKFAVFNIKGRSYTFPIGDNKICTITVPREALKSTHFRVSIFGGDMLTTNSVKILLGEKIRISLDVNFGNLCFSLVLGMRRILKF